MQSLRTVVLLALCLPAMQGVAQEKMFEKVETEANTDQRVWQQHVKRVIKLPDSVVKKIPPGEYFAMVQFVVDKYGNVGNIELIKDPGYGLGRIALQVVRSYKGEWKPAYQCGRAVNAYRKQPVRFVFNE